MPQPSSVTRGATRKKELLKQTEGSTCEVQWEDVGVEIGVGGGVAVGSEDPPSYKTRKKECTTTQRADMEAVARHAKARNIRTVLPALETRVYGSFRAVEEAIELYCARNNTSMTVRTSNRREWKNDQLHRRFDAAKAKAALSARNFKGQLHLLPPTMEYFQKVYKCVHAECQPNKVPDEEREREQRSTKYTDCSARITAEAVQVRVDGEWVWRVVLRQENYVHNHACTPAVFATYNTSSSIADEALFEMSAAQIAVGGNPRQIRDQISDGLGFTYSRTQYSNLCNYRLGGGAASDNLERLLEQFTAEEGNRCTVLHDQDEMIIGIILQSAIQRRLFRHYGESLILDWTHNTNNLGFHLGCLLATSVTGKGLPVLDFLCLSQGVDMMRSVLEVFVEGSEDALDVVESFVIDKDYKEWKAVNTVFARAAVVLCQFHVLKWFKTVVADARHEIPKNARPVVLKLVRQMMYSESREDLLRHKAQLLSLLPLSTHDRFQTYMDKRWYSCQSMWANYVRGKVFTAGNTTSNRLESHWNQFKAALGKRRRIDHCVEMIFIRATTILRRELAEITSSTAKTRLLRNEHEFMREVLHDLSITRAELVKHEWKKYQSRFRRFYCPSGVEDDGTCAVFPSRLSGVRFVVSALDDQYWTCTCRFASSSRLPCRHQLFVAKNVKGFASFPVRALARRWRLSAAEDLLEHLEESVESLARMRLAKVVERRAMGVPCVDVVVKLPTRKKTVVYRQLHRFERANCVVLGDIEKRNIVEAQCERVVERLMVLGTPDFWSVSARWEDVILAFLSTLNIKDRDTSGESTSDANSSAAPAPTADDVPAPTADDVPAPTADDAPAPNTGDDQDGGGSGATEHDVDEQVEEHDYAAAALESLSDVDDDDDDDAGDDEDSGCPAPHNASIIGVTGGIEGAGTIDEIADVGFAPIDRPDLTEPQSYSGAVRFPARTQREIDDLLSQFIPGELGEDNEVAVLSRILMRGSQSSLTATTPPINETFWPVGSMESRHSSPPFLVSPAPASPPSPARPTPASLTPASLTPASPPSPGGTASTRPRRSIYDLLNAVCEDKSSSEDDEKSSSVEHVQAVGRKRAPLESPQSIGASKRHKDGTIIRGEFKKLLLPSATRGVPRSTKQQARRSVRLGVEVQMPILDPIISVSDLGLAVRHAPLREARDIAKRYPRHFGDDRIDSHPLIVRRSHDHVQPLKFLLSSTATDAVLAAISAKRAECGDSSGDDSEGFSRGQDEYVATVPGVGLHVSERHARAIARFYCDRALLIKLSLDRDWLDLDGTWIEPAKQDVPFLDEYAWECAQDPSEERSVVDVMRHLVLSRLDDLSLDTVVEASPGGPVGVPVRELLGRLSHSTWLNDSTLYLALSIMALRNGDVDPLHKGKMVIPVPPIKQHRLVVFPINFDNAHWCIVLVVLSWGAAHNAFVYDPLCSQKYARRLEQVWVEWIRPLLDAWYERDEGSFGAAFGLGHISRATVLLPKQTDASNCGVFCAAQALCYIAGDFALHQLAHLSPSQLLLMRLRMLYMLLIKSTTRVDEKQRLRAVEAISAFRSSDAWD